MTQQEFETHVNFTLSPNEYIDIEEMYICGSYDIDEFCTQWIENGGIGEILRARASFNKPETKSGKLDNDSDFL